MAVNKIDINNADGTTSTLIDLTSDSVTENDLIEGVTAHTSDGESIVGKLKLSDKNVFSITEDIVTVTTDATKGVAPYSTSYGYTNITVSEDSGISWVEGGIYVFVINANLVVSSSYRNVRIRIGEDDVWHPLMSDTSILGGSSYFTKSQQRLFVYKSTYRPEGALHWITDSNTTYAYLVNSISAGGLKIDDNGYGARYSLAFATTPLYDDDGIVADERFSSLVKSSSTGTTKVAATPKSGKFYIDRHPQYIYSASIAAGELSVNATYQNYYGLDLRYTCNTSATYMTATKKAFLYLKDFNTSDYSFTADNTIGNVCTIDKLSTRFPDTIEGSVYLYFLGWTTTWYQLSPNFQDTNRIYKYTPSTGEFIEFLASRTSETSSSGTGLTEEQESAISANTLARHTHNNKGVLDGITAEKIAEWDAKQDADIIYEPIEDEYAYEEFNEEGSVTMGFNCDPSLPNLKELKTILSTTLRKAYLNFSGIFFELKYNGEGSNPIESEVIVGTSKATLYMYSITGTEGNRNCMFKLVVTDYEKPVLTFTGAVNSTWDGSESVEVEIPEAPEIDLFIVDVYYDGETDRWSSETSLADIVRETQSGKHVVAMAYWSGTVVEQFMLRIAVNNSVQQIADFYTINNDRRLRLWDKHGWTIEFLTSNEHSHDNKSILDDITTEKVSSWDAKSDFSGSYDDLSDKPIVNLVEYDAESDSEFCPYIPSELLEMMDNSTIIVYYGNSLTYYEHNIYNSEDDWITFILPPNNTITIKADKSIEFGEYDFGIPTEDDINGLIDAKTDGHSHDNKSVIDGITSDKVSAWDNKSDFSGSYNDLTDKPTIPEEIVIDSELSSTSENPVQNKVIKEELDKTVRYTILNIDEDFDSIDFYNLTDGRYIISEDSTYEFSFWFDVQERSGKYLSVGMKKGYRFSIKTYSGGTHEYIDDYSNDNNPASFSFAKDENDIVFYYPSSVFEVVTNYNIGSYLKERYNEILDSSSNLEENILIPKYTPYAISGTQRNNPQDLYLFNGHKVDLIAYNISPKSSWSWSSDEETFSDYAILQYVSCDTNGDWVLNKITVFGNKTIQVESNKVLTDTRNNLVNIFYKDDYNNTLSYYTPSEIDTLAENKIFYYDKSIVHYLKIISEKAYCYILTNQGTAFYTVNPDKTVTYDFQSNNHHSHDNKTYIDELSDNYINGLIDAKTDGHSHSNKSVLDGITAEKTSSWNSKAEGDHTHTEYARSNHNHNGIYASAQHTHDEYASEKTQVIVTLDNTDFTNGTAIVDRTFSEIMALDDNVEFVIENLGGIYLGTFVRSDNRIEFQILHSNIWYHFIIVSDNTCSYQVSTIPMIRPDISWAEGYMHWNTIDTDMSIVSASDMDSHINSLITTKLQELDGTGDTF